MKNLCAFINGGTSQLCTCNFPVKIKIKIKKKTLGKPTSLFPECSRVRSPSELVLLHSVVELGNGDKATKKATTQGGRPEKVTTS